MNQFIGYLANESIELVDKIGQRGFLILEAFNMLLDALSWNILNVIRVELFFDCFNIWDIFVKSSLQSPRGQRAMVSLAITLLAQTSVQFNWSWLITIYSIYLSVGMCNWLYRRVYFYHRKLDSAGVNSTINSFDTTKLNGGTLKHDHKNQKGSNGSGDSTSSYSSSSSNGHSSERNYADYNSLQRQRVSAYRDFQSVLTEPRRNYREFILSLSHLSHISKLLASEDVFDEMHFQILATRRDVINILIRFVLVIVTNFLAYFK